MDRCFISPSFKVRHAPPWSSRQDRDYNSGLAVKLQAFEASLMFWLRMCLWFRNQGDDSSRARQRPK